MCARVRVDGDESQASLDTLDAQHLATRLMGDAIATNLFLLGFAWQKGMVPVSHEALMRAIELNGVAIEMNRKVFLWGRRAAHGLDAVERCASPAEVVPIKARSLDETIGRRVAELTAYQDSRYATRYRQLVERAREAELSITGDPKSTRLGTTVARNLFKLMAYKDEYEVARLYCDPVFWRRLEDTFDGDYEVRFHLAPPFLARPDPGTGRIPKRPYGPWMRRVFSLLARMRHLRGTPWDMFGRSEERRVERALIMQYETDITELLEGLSFLRLPLAVEIASWPDGVRGFGPVKRYSCDKAQKTRRQALERWRETAPSTTEAGRQTA